MALEALGQKLYIATLYPPKDSFRHERLQHIEAEVLYPPPSTSKKTLKDSDDFQALLSLVEKHNEQYGVEHKAETRALNACAMAIELRKKRVRHIHVHFANRATHTALFLKHLGFSFSFTAHAQDFMVDIIDEALLQEMCAEAEFVIAVSDFSKNLLTKSYPNQAAKIQRLYNGINLSEFLPSFQIAAEGPLQILSVGRLISFKGFDLLIEACAFLLQSGIDFCCRIVGDGPERANLENQITGLGLQKHVFLLGLQSQNQIRNLLHQSQVFALACRVDEKGASDVLPTVITEAMACGLPVVSTTVAGIPEMVIDRETGLVVETENPRAFSEALSTLANTPSLRETYGAQGQKRAQTLFDGEKTAPQLAALFSQKSLPSSSKSQPQILYLCEHWDDQSDELRTVLHEPSTRLYACQASTPKTLKNPQPSPDHLSKHLPTLPSFLPEALVLESYWLANPDLRIRCEELRQVLPASQGGEEYFTIARRAVYLCSNVIGSNIEHLHAYRSSSALLVWLLAKLTGLSSSLSIGPDPKLPRSTLRKIAGDFTLINVGDKTMQESIDGHDVLGLSLPLEKIRKFGPLKISAQKPEAVEQKQARHRAWLSELHNLLS